MAKKLCVFWYLISFTFYTSCIRKLFIVAAKSFVACVASIKILYDNFLGNNPAEGKKCREKAEASNCHNVFNAKNTSFFDARA